MQLTYRPASSTRAFTLVEMSIVLVIIGLIVGSVMAGRNLVQSSQLTKAANQMVQLNSAVGAFKSQYGGLPGDITNATTYWGNYANPNCTNSLPSDSYYPGTCNGDGNGIIEKNPVGPNFHTEMTRAVQQLALAGLISGTYNGTSTTSGYFTVLGINEPPAALQGLGFTVAQDEFTTTINVITLGRPNMTMMSNAALTPEQAMNFDTKIDDGLPNSGKVQGMTGFYPDDGNWSCISGSAYNTANGGFDCIVRFMIQ